MAVGNGKGGNKGKPATYSAKPATLSMGSPFVHEKPNLDKESETRPGYGRLGHRIIPPGAKYLR